MRIAPHRHKLALFDGLSPDLAVAVRDRVLGSVRTVWSQFERLYATWRLVGEERQVHYGENYLDPPDLAAAALAVRSWLLNAPAEELSRRVDLPFCRADLFHVQKLAWTLDAMTATEIR